MSGNDPRADEGLVEAMAEELHDILCDNDRCYGWDANCGRGLYLYAATAALTAARSHGGM